VSSASSSIGARLAEFRDLRARGALCTEVSEHLANEAATLFLSEYRSSGKYLADAITLLAEIATLEEPCLSQPGLRAAFPKLIERLSDSFDPQLCAVYDRVFTQMISLARQLPAAARLDETLRRFGLRTEQDILNRKALLRTRTTPLAPEACGRVKKVLVLSRVTLGADVAITSIVLQSAQHTFPGAETVLFAPAKAQELFGGNPALRVHPLAYASGGTLLERLGSWADVLAAVEDETRGLAPDECLLLDPDSRYLQLGLLPALADESRYFFFESRSAGADTAKNLSTLTLEWLNSTFGRADSIFPRVWLRDADVSFGADVRARQHAGGAQRLVAISFGAGGNDEKRLAGSFEESLVFRLIEEGCTVLLDKGASESELTRARHIVEAVRDRGGIVAETNASSNARHVPPRCRMVTWHGGIGGWAGIVAAADEYIGYDSSGQHIAAACGIPAIDVFSAETTPVFRARWTPGGEAAIRTAVAREGNSPETGNDLTDEVMRIHRAMRVADVRKQQTARQ
jgi:ADP-heptose:LPS heptosyltransferase